MMEQDKDGRSPLRGSGHQPTASAAVPASSQSGVPNAIIAPAPEPTRIAAIARIATARLDGLVGPPAWGAAEVAARHGYLYGYYAALAVALEYAAVIAKGFVGQAKRNRIASGWKMARFQPHERDEIAAEENGGNIVAHEIAAAIRAASGIEAATAGETRSGSAEGESPARSEAEGDAQNAQPSIKGGIGRGG